jgi:hypothetical protein
MVVSLAGRGYARVAFAFTIADGKIVDIEMLAGPDRIRELHLAILESPADSP